MIRLYYIENISETDIPYFEDIYAMNGFFTSHQVDTISGEGSYYPPYYTNRIKLSIAGDINYEGTSVNYLALDYGSKRYFYFIDSIDYVNEDCYEINIHMDTIMTFYFDIEVSAAMVERAFINRWGDTGTPTINRDYIRENFSNGNYKIVEHSYVDGLASDSWVVIAEVNHVKINESLEPEQQYPARIVNNWSQPTRQIFIDANGNSVDIRSTHKQGIVLWSFANAVYDMTTYDKDRYQASYAYPNYTYTSPLGHGTDAVTGGFIDNPINHLIDNPNLHNIFIIPFIPFSKDVSISLTGTRAYTLTINPLFMNFGGMNKPVDDPIKLRFGYVRGAYSPNFFQSFNVFKGAYAGKMSPFAPIRSVVHNSTYNPPLFSKNTNIGVTFDKEYCPQLYDTNYMQITFGSLYANTTYPIEYLTSDGLYGKYYADCFTGKRYYYITKASDNYFDEYKTIVCDDNILSLEMLNDPWKDYEANNRSRWATIGVGAGVNAVKDLINVASIAGGMGAINDSALLQKYIINRDMDKRKKKAKDIGKARIALTEIDRKEDIRSSQMGMLKSGIGILDSATAVTSQLEKEYNLQHAPQTIIRGGDETSVVSSQGWAIRWIRHECENIEQVAQIYHRIGYNVQKYEPNTIKLQPLFNKYKLRYYYNIVKLGECSVHIVKRMENEDIVLDIKRRLQEGIRYWNISVADFELCNFKYDNVELAYL